MPQDTIELGPIRPPSEGGASSLLLRVTRNCPWNRCAFCPFYRGTRFYIRPVGDIKRDIDTVRKMVDNISSVEFDPVGHMVYSWYVSGASTVFLQDSNSLIMPDTDLKEVLSCLKDTFSSVKRVTSYARSDTILRKDDLEGIRNAGLVRLHVGLESGDDEVLRLMNKGVTAEQHIEAGLKAKDAGFELSEYVMPGLGGTRLSEQHAMNTAKVLNEIDPDFIRFRPLVIHPASPLKEMHHRGEFELNSPHSRLRELKILIEGLDVSSRLCFDHWLNGWKNAEGGNLFSMSYEGYELPRDGEMLLKLIEEGLGVSEDLHFDPRKSERTSI